MAAPLGGASPLNSKKIQDREDAIRRRLKLDDLRANMKGGNTSFPKKGSRTAIKPGGKPARTQQQSFIKGAKEGFTKSDYGVLEGAAIPYQIGKQNVIPGRTGTKPVVNPPTALKPRTAKKVTPPPPTATKPKIGG